MKQLGLLSPAEEQSLRGLFGDALPLRTALRRSDSVHLHVRVDDVANLPRDALAAARGRVENERDGYIKYAFPGGTNLIFSAIDVAEDDRLPGARRVRPHLDHLGLDLRSVDRETRELFDAAPQLAEKLGWRHVAQGSPDKAVFCCHTSVAEKHWLYPNSTDALPFPIELAHGPLQIHADSMGCDLRPLDPAHPQASAVKCCGTEAGTSAPTVAPRSLVRQPRT